MPPNTSTSQDEEHLKLLSIFHYVLAGVTGLCALFPLIHLAMGLFLIFAGDDMSKSGDAPPAFVGWLFVGIAVVLIVAGLSLAALMLMTGRKIAQRKGYTFCQVMAGMECLFMPFGTILGVFTLIVLSRDSVKRLFATS